MTSRILALLVICCSLISRQAFAQSGRTTGMDIPFRTPGSDSIKIVKILNANTYHFEQKDTVEIQYWVGKVRIKQDNTLIDCDSMIMIPKQNFIESFGHVHINDNDSTNIYSDYMKYQVDTKTVHFLRNVKLTDGKGVLTTEDLTYDLNTKIGVYEHGGKIVNNGSVLTSEQATYYEETKDVYFKKNVLLKDPQYNLTTDSLLYNTQTQVSTFITETDILFNDSTHRSVHTKSGYYDLKNRKAEFGRRPIITDGSQRITGDSVQVDDSTGISTATGHAVYKDTTEGIMLIADYMISNKKTKSFLATQHPLMILKQEKDSIYITADTLFSGRLIDAPHLKKQVETTDSLHNQFIESLQQESADSLHNAALRTRTPQDTLIALGGDSSAAQTVRDRSDSLKRTGRDSGSAVTASLDSLRKARAVRVADSTRMMAMADSAHNRLHAEIARNYIPVDSTKDRIRADSARNRMHSDSIRQAGLTDSTAALSKADSLRAGLPGKGKKLPVHRPVDRPRPGGQRPGGPPGSQRPAGAQQPPGSTPPPEIARLPESAQKPRSGEPDRDHEKYTDTSSAPVTDTSLRYILGYHHVRIFSDSLQAVADSLYYSTQDSVFRLFKEPVAWGNGDYQITGDTMYVYTKNKKASRLYVFENGLAINKIGSNFYNQLKGTTINAYFKGGEVDYMRAKGNAESIYYVQDENRAYTGVNKAHADIIDMIFALKDSGQGRELRRVVLRNDAEGSMIPFKKVSFDDMRLRGFRWQEARRPKRKEDLFE